MKKILTLLIFVPFIAFTQIPTNQNLSGIHFFTPERGIITTESGKMYQTTNAGNLWTEMPQITTSYIRYFARADANTYFITGYNGTLLKSVDNGLTWTLMNCGTNIQLTQMTFTDPMTGYLLGINGFAKKSTDGGETWVQMDIPTIEPVTSIQFINDSTGFIGGFGHVYKTTNAGQTWTAVLNDSPGVSFQDLFFIDSLKGVAAGYSGRVYITSDGGDNWVQVSSGTTNNLYDITFSTGTTGFIVGKFGTMLRTSDGGNTWTPVTLTPSLTVNSMVEFTNGLNGYSVGSDGTVFYTADSGYTWNTSPPPIQTGSITGTVMYKNADSTILNNGKVFLWDNQNNKIDSTNLNSQGHFEFNGLASGTYHVTARPIYPWGGVNSADALLTLKHFTHVITLSGLSLQAANVNGIQGVNSLDALLIQKRFTQYINSFNIDDWVSDNEIVTIVSTETHNITLHTLCTGDVNGSYIPNNTASPCPQIPTFTYGGQTYNTVQIGSQCWMKSNLNIGDMISSSVLSTNNGTIEKYCWNNNISNCDVFGGLYSWNELMSYSTIEGAQGICPDGWHVPTDDEFCTMITYLDPTVNCSTPGWTGTNVGGKLKETGTSHWSYPNTGATNESGFTALGSGYWSNYDGDPTFYSSYIIQSMWTSTQVSSQVSKNYYIYYNNSNIYHQQLNTSHYYISVRCILN